jgi:lipopolysaccharide/colanic/teichoic acid biosynthesis glycosyltransferase
MLNKSFLPSSRISLGVRLQSYDIACAALAPWLAVWLRDTDFLTRFSFADTLAYCLVSFAISLIAFAWLRVGHGLTRFFSANEALELFKACAIAMAVTAFVMFTFTRLDAAPRSRLAIHLFVLTGLLSLGRLVSRRAERRRARARSKSAERASEGAAAENIIVVGASRLAAHYIRMIDDFAAENHKIVALLDDNPRFRGRSVCGRLVIGGPDDLADILDEYRVHGLEISRIVVASDLRAFSPQRWHALRSECDARGLNFQFLPERLGLLAPGIALSRAEETAPNAAESAAALRRRPYWKVKRGLDLTVAGLTAILTAPAFMIVAAVVLIDVGAPVTFWQQRIGRGGRPIHVYKFRTLRATFTRDGAAVAPENRLSRTGAFLRATRLDELPQLYNILIGDMSIVGPRPLLPVDQPEDASLRLAVPPGLTGWAQIHGGKLITAEEKNALDEWYVRNASFALDAEILLRTAWTMFTGDVRNDAVVEAALSEQRERVVMPESSPGGMSDTSVSLRAG